MQIILAPYKLLYDLFLNQISNLYATITPTVISFYSHSSKQKYTLTHRKLNQWLPIFKNVKRFMFTEIY